MYPQLFDLVGNLALASDLQFDVMCAFDDAARHATKIFYASQDSVTHAGLCFNHYSAVLLQRARAGHGRDAKVCG